MIDFQNALRRFQAASSGLHELDEAIRVFHDLTEADDCRWVTIGAQEVTYSTKKGDKTKREGGVPVCINDLGIILKGPKKMLGNSASNPNMTLDTTGNEKDNEGNPTKDNKAPPGWTGPYYGKKSALEQHATYGDSLSFKDFKKALADLSVGIDGPPPVSGMSGYDKRTLADIANAFSAIQKTFGDVLKIGKITGKKMTRAYASAHVSDTFDFKDLNLANNYFKDYDLFVATKKAQEIYSPNFSLSQKPAHTVIHEAGHLLDEKWIFGPFRKFLKETNWNVSEYAKEKRSEQVAEAFLSLMMTPHDEFDDMQKKAWNALIAGVQDEEIRTKRRAKLSSFAAKKKEELAGRAKIDDKIKQIFGKKSVKSLMNKVLPKHGQPKNMTPEELDEFGDAMKDLAAMNDLVKKNKNIYGLNYSVKNAAFQIQKFAGGIWNVEPGETRKVVAEYRKKMEALVKDFGGKV